jgi:uncharacterized protein (TIGR02145 family)
MKPYYHKIFVLILLISGLTKLSAQIGIGTKSPHSSSVLEVKSTTKGFLLPRMTTTQREAIMNPEDGLIIYNTTERCIEQFMGNTFSPNWLCINPDINPTGTLVCSESTINGEYIQSVPLDSNNFVRILIVNNDNRTKHLYPKVSDISLIGVNGIHVESVNHSYYSLATGDSVFLEYNITGTPSAQGLLEVNWLKQGNTCQLTKNVLFGKSKIDSLQEKYFIALDNPSPSIVYNRDLSNSINFQIPYTNGKGNYHSFTGNYVNAIGRNGDQNGFRLVYNAGSFTTNGFINATIEIDGDQLFNILGVEVVDTAVIVDIPLVINGDSLGIISLRATSGVLDRNFNDPEHKFVYLPITAADGNVWLNNNLGCYYADFTSSHFKPDQQAIFYNDYRAYGSTHQWGRASDGHELNTYSSATNASRKYTYTTTLSSSINPNHKFHIYNNQVPHPWLTFTDNTLWANENSVNNPCPVGFRVPTTAEWEALLLAEGITNRQTAFQSSLKLPSAGKRRYYFGQRQHTGVQGYYWSTTSNDISPTQERINGLRFDIVDVETNKYEYRGDGLYTRCIKD